MSTSETMTIHKALSELKVIGERITKGLNKMPFVLINEHVNTKIQGVDISEYTKQMMSAHQAVVDLINRRNAIKRAVVKSNATTIVVIAGKEYTVAEAIEMKNHGMEFVKLLMGKMASELDRAKRNAEINNGSALESRADGYIRNLFNTTDMKNLTAEAKSARDEFIKQHTTELVDPLKVSDKIAALEKEYYDFITEVDAILSVSNATTEIEVVY